MLLAGLVSVALIQTRAARAQQPPTFNTGATSPASNFTASDFTTQSADPKNVYPEVPPDPAGVPATYSGNFGVEQPWSWQGLPDGLMYRSYLAGVKEPRLGVVMANAPGFGNIWDVALGGRVGLLRYGTTDAYRPEGWQLDFAGVALPRLQPLEPSSPLVSTDFAVSVPITYAQGPWQFKTGYAHVSAHLGDEYMQLHPTVTRVNYVRDAIMCGLGYYWTDDLRLYAEVDYAVGINGGALPWDFQMGVDYSPAVRGSAPFVAVYGDVRPEVDGGYFVVQTGWQCRGGMAMHTYRVGVEYLNGKSPQFEFFRQFEHHVGLGMWYDY